MKALPFRPFYPHTYLIKCHRIYLLLVVLIAIMDAAREMYQKTETALKSTAEKTTTFLGGISTGLSAKIGAVKNSDTFRSMEERVGSVYTNVKSKVVTSRSSSSHELDEALKEAEAQREAANLSSGLAVSGSSSTATPTTTPTQSEKPVA